MWKQLLNANITRVDPDNMASRICSKREKGSLDVWNSITDTVTGTFARIVSNALLNVTNVSKWRYTLEQEAVRWTEECISNLRRQPNTELGVHVNYISSTQWTHYGEEINNKIKENDYILAPPEYIDIINKAIGQTLIYSFATKETSLIINCKGAIKSTHRDLYILCLIYIQAKHCKLLKESQTAEIELFEELIKGLNQKQKPDLAAIIIEYMKKVPGWTKDASTEIRKYLKEKEQRKIRDVKYAIERARNEIQNYLDAIVERQASIQDNSLKLEALENASDEESIKELLHVLDTYTYVYSYSYEEYDHGIEVVIRRPIECSDTTEWERVCKNNWKNPAARFTKAAFCDNKFIMYVEETVLIKTDTAPRSQTHYKGISAKQCKNTMFQPHLHYYNCWGNYASVMAECLAEGNLAATIEQVIEVVGGINSYDTPVRTKFWDEINYSENVKFALNKETNEWWSLQDFIENEKEENNETV